MCNKDGGTCVCMCACPVSCCVCACALVLSVVCLRVRLSCRVCACVCACPVSCVCARALVLSVVVLWPGRGAAWWPRAVHHSVMHGQVDSGVNLRAYTCWLVSNLLLLPYKLSRCVYCFVECVNV